MTVNGIGGVSPAPEPSSAIGSSVWNAWTSPFRNVSAYRTARAALAAVLRMRGPGRVWLPSYVCDTLNTAAGAAICWYAVGPDLELQTEQLEAGLAEGDAVVVVDYFGRSPGPELEALVRRRRDVFWIEDRAQALQPDRPPFGDVLIYSPRKLFGVADGGLLVSDGSLPQPEPGSDEPDLWAPNEARASDPDGHAPHTWYPTYQTRERAFDVEPLPMSSRTREVLQSASLQAEAAARKANWTELADRLADYALWPDATPAFAPLVYPVVVDDPAAVAARLAEQRIWCPRHWASLPSPPDAFPEAHSLAARCLSLPLDGRYEQEDMIRVAEAVRAAARPAQAR